MDAKIHNNHQHSSGKLSLFLSILCLVHCIATPLLLMAFPLLSIYLKSFHTAEWYLLGISFILGVLSIKHGMDNHYKSFIPIIIFIIGMGIAALSHLIFDESMLANALLVIGGIVAAIAQYYNLKLSRSFS
jgi:hypothetical protein